MSYLERKRIVVDPSWIYLCLIPVTYVYRLPWAANATSTYQWNLAIYYYFHLPVLDLREITRLMLLGMSKCVRTVQIRFRYSMCLIHQLIVRNTTGTSQNDRSRWNFRQPRVGEGSYSQMCVAQVILTSVDVFGLKDSSVIIGDYHHGKNFRSTGRGGGHLATFPQVTHMNNFFCIHRSTPSRSESRASGIGNS